MKIKTNYGKVLIQNSKHEIEYKNVKCVRQKLKWNYILITYENMKWNEQSYV
jgi:hypothetical protein